MRTQLTQRLTHYPIQFHDAGTEKVEQAWSVEPIDGTKGESNAKTLGCLAHLLKEYPDLYCITTLTVI